MDKKNFQISNSIQRYGVIPFDDASLGEVQNSKVAPEAQASLQALNQERASVLPIALGAMISSNRGAQNFGNQLYDYGIKGKSPLPLAHGVILPDGEYLTDDSSQQLKADSNAMRREKHRQDMERREEENRQANIIPDQAGGYMVDPNAPWGGLRQKESMTMRNQTMKNANDQLEDMRKALRQEAQSVQLMKEFGDMNQRNRTGGIYDKIAPDWMHTGEHSAMIAKQNQLAPIQRPEGSGATSDFEQKMYKAAVPNIGNTGNTNAQIRLSAEAIHEVRKARLSFYESYLAKFGHLNGAERAFAPQVKAIEERFAPLVAAYGAKSKQKSVPNSGFSIDPAGE